MFSLPSFSVLYVLIFEVPHLFHVSPILFCIAVYSICLSLSFSFFLFLCSVNCDFLSLCFVNRILSLSYFPPLVFSFYSATLSSLFSDYSLFFLSVLSYLIIFCSFFTILFVYIFYFYHCCHDSTMSCNAMHPIVIADFRLAAMNFHLPLITFVSRFIDNFCVLCFPFS